MSTEYKGGYMLLFRGNDWDKGLSPEEIQRVTGEFMAWFQRLSNEGRVKAASPLENEGKIISGKKGRTVADGPFAESKEAIGGYFLIEASSLEEAVEVGRECPTLEYGGKVEVRPVASTCPVSRRAQELTSAVA
jgi:hypothetical protein